MKGTQLYNRYRYNLIRYKIGPARKGTQLSLKTDKHLYPFRYIMVPLFLSVYRRDMWLPMSRCCWIVPTNIFTDLKHLFILSWHNVNNKISAEFPGLCVFCKKWVVMIKSEKTWYGGSLTWWSGNPTSSCFTHCWQAAARQQQQQSQWWMNGGESEAVSIYSLNVLNWTELKMSSLDKTKIIWSSFLKKN